MISRRWFGRVVPDRDQTGNPLPAIVAAFDVPGAELVLRADSDMLFCEQGWWSEASRILSNGDADLVEPPRLGNRLNSDTVLSARALIMRPEMFGSRCLPIKACRLDLLRRFHRRLHGRNTFLGIEAMLEFQRKTGPVRHIILDNSLGFSIHVNDRRLAPWGWFDGVVRRIEIDDLPKAQYEEDCNFSRSAW